MVGNALGWEGKVAQFWSVVDGGHRAIKYSRLQGVKADIYPEGTHLVVCLSLLPKIY